MVTYMCLYHTCMRVLATSNGLLPSVLNVPADIPPKRFSIGVNARPDSPAILYCTMIVKHLYEHARCVSHEGI
jgi:hypothetical protein